jgi:hypothetical protein
LSRKNTHWLRHVRPSLHVYTHDHGFSWADIREV